MSRVVLGFSGGVDSAVSARLLQRQGHEVLGVYLDTGTAEQCAETEQAAGKMGIPLSIVPVKALLEEKVCRPFIEAYLNGRTPNPCIMCNPAVKFRCLLQEADRLGAPFVATGHYARSENGGLYKGHPDNDQSYMLCRLTREQAARLLLPLGPFSKKEVRAMAEEMDLPAAHKKDSMEICFIPDKDYLGWLSARAELPGPGPLLFNGERIGIHGGICGYTVGQRYPGLLNERKVYVSRLDPKTNSVTLALWEDLFTRTVLAKDFSYLYDVPEGPFQATVRVRHTKWENPPCTVYREDGHVRIECETPVRAPAPGQSAVLYQGDRLLGGGAILESLPD